LTPLSPLKLSLFAGVNYFLHKDFNDVWESDDAINWRPLTTNAPWSGRWDDDVTYHRGNFWLAGGMNLKHEGFNDVWYSKDGANWSLALEHAPWSERQGQVLLSKDGILYLFGGLGASSNEGIGDTWFTKDGFNWQRTNSDGYWIGREDHQVLLFKEKYRAQKTEEARTRLQNEEIQERARRTKFERTGSKNGWKGKSCSAEHRKAIGS
jgi:hypothetical protein